MFLSAPLVLNRIGVESDHEPKPQYDIVYGLGKSMYCAQFLRSQLVSNDIWYQVHNMTTLPPWLNYASVVQSRPSRRLGKPMESSWTAFTASPADLPPYGCTHCPGLAPGLSYPENP